MVDDVPYALMRAASRLDSLDAWSTVATTNACEKSGLANGLATGQHGAENHAESASGELWMSRQAFIDCLNELLRREGLCKGRTLPSSSPASNHFHRR